MAADMFEGREILTSRLHSLLGTLVSSVEIAGQNNLSSSHVVAETTMAGLLNRVYGWELVNANAIQQNYPGVDLIDTERNIAVQVTATRTTEKVRHTLEEAGKSGLIYLKALDIQKKSLSPEHPDLATSYGNVGATYNALRNHHKALTIVEKALPPEHPHLAVSCNNIAWTYHKLGDFQSAAPAPGCGHHRALRTAQNPSPPGKLPQMGRRVREEGRDAAQAPVPVHGLEPQSLPLRKEVTRPNHKTPSPKGTAFPEGVFSCIPAKFPTFSSRSAILQT